MTSLRKAMTSLWSANGVAANFCEVALDFDDPDAHSDAPDLGFNRPDP